MLEQAGTVSGARRERKITATVSCQIEIHFLIHNTKLLLNYDLFSNLSQIFHNIDLTLCQRQHFIAVY